jgi:hypothetical protein
MRRHLLFLILSIAAASAQEPPDYSPLVGVYDLIGRKPDSRETYSGTITLISTSTGLRVERRVGGNIVIGAGQFRFKTPDKIKVLEISFKDGQDTFESSCRTGWDLDNYARITCLYGIIGKTKAPGMEAFFIQREPN